MEIKMNRNSIVDLISHASKHIEEAGSLLKDFTFFSYMKFDESGKDNILTNHPKLYKHFFEQSYPLIAPIPQRFLNTQFHYFIPENGPYANAVKDACQLAQCNNFIDIVFVKKDTIEVFCFGGKLSINDIICKLDWLYQFTYYFKDRIGGPTSDILLKSGLVLPTDIRPDKLVYTTKCDNQTAIKLDTKRYYVSIGERQFILTRQVMKCLLLLSIGYDYRSIARVLEISHRTVECHIDKAKLQLDCYRKCDLIHKVKQFNGYRYLIASFIK